MSSNSNQPPFFVGQKVVAIRNSTPGFDFVYTKGDVKVVTKCFQALGCEWSIDTEDSGGYSLKAANFRPINPYQSDVTKELAEQALSVGDSVDQPVKKLVNN